jgi:hypothetical protein
MPAIFGDPVRSSGEPGMQATKPAQQLRVLMGLPFAVSAG